MNKARTHLGREVLQPTSLVKKKLQAKLTVGAINDPAEAEADRVAARVMRMPEVEEDQEQGVPVQEDAPEMARAEAEDEEQAEAVPVQEDAPEMARAAEDEEPAETMPVEEDAPEMARKMATDTAYAEDASGVVEPVLRSPGQPLDAETRRFMEPRFGHDFSNVRVHADDVAARSAEQVNAKAYTVGNDLAFGAGEYAPGTSAGKQLLAHELTHVVQQDGANKVSREPEDSTESRTGYVGFNPDAKKELKAVENQAGKKNVSGSLDSKKKERELYSIDGMRRFVMESLGLEKDKDAERYQKSIRCLVDCAPAYRDQMADLMTLFDGAEKHKYTLERLVLSGHHKLKWMWGDVDSDSSAILDEIEQIEMLRDQEKVETAAIRDQLRALLNAKIAALNSKTFALRTNLPNLVQAFPTAASQVIDLMLSACNTRHHIQWLRSLFPNLQSIWVYSDTSPNINTGSVEHVKQWARTTKGSSVPNQAKVHAKLKRQGDHVQIWSAQAGSPLTEK